MEFKKWFGVLLLVALTGARNIAAERKIGGTGHLTCFLDSSSSSSSDCSSSDVTPCDILTRLESVESIVQEIASVVHVSTCPSTIDSISMIVMGISDIVSANACCSTVLAIESIVEDISNNVGANSCCSTIQSIESIVENISETLHANACCSTVQSIESIVEDISNVVHANSCCSTVQSIESIVENISGVVHANACCTTVQTIESIVEDISDVVNANACCSTVAGIDSKVDILLADADDACDAVIIHQADVDAQGGIYTIAATGRYCLAQDILGSFFINQLEVTLDLNSHIILVPGPAAGVELNSGAIGCTIINGAIVGIMMEEMIQGGDPIDWHLAPNRPTPTVGIQIDTNSGGHVIDNIILEFFDIGILVESDANFIRSIQCGNTTTGIQCLTGNVLVIEDSLFYNFSANALEFAQYNLNARNCEFLGPTTTPTSINCAYVHDADVVRFENCRFDNAPGYGLLVENTHALECINCFANGNSADGFFVHTTNPFPNAAVDILFENCIADNNAFNGFHTLDAYDLTMNNCVSQNNQNGFFTEGSASGIASIIRSCTAQGNTNSGTGVGFKNTVGNNGTSLFCSNIACSNDMNYQGVASAPVTSPANAVGVENVDCSNNAPSTINEINSTLDGCCTTIHSIDSKVDVLLVDADDACDAVIVHQTDVNAQGGIYTITTSGRYCLAEDITGSFLVNGDQVTIDLNSHIIIVLSTIPGIELSGGHGALVITNGALIGTTIPGDPTWRDRVGPVIGIQLDNNAGANVVDNVVVEFFDVGILISGGGNTIKSVRCGNCMTGLQCLLGDTLLVTDSIFDTNFVNGLEFSNSTLTVRDTVFNNSKTPPSSANCMWLHDAATIRLEGCTFNNSPNYGLLIDNCNEVYCIDCVATDNAVDGFFVQTMSGIDRVSSDIVFNNCIAGGNNMGDGFHALDVFNLVMNNCTAQNNQNGFFTEGSTSGIASIIRSCTAQGNTNSGTGVGFKNTIGNNGTSKFYSNVACANDINYQGVTDAPVTSGANAVGVENVDCSINTSSTINAINSKLDVLLGCPCS